jgi:hypothetical protein
MARLTQADLAAKAAENAITETPAWSLVDKVIHVKPATVSEILGKLIPEGEKTPWIRFHLWSTTFGFSQSVWCVNGPGGDLVFDGMAPLGLCEKHQKGKIPKTCKDCAGAGEIVSRFLDVAWDLQKCEDPKCAESDRADGTDGREKHTSNWCVLTVGEASTNFLARECNTGIRVIKFGTYKASSFPKGRDPITVPSEVVNSGVFPLPKANPNTLEQH